MAIEIVDFPIKNGGSFHSISVYSHTVDIFHGSSVWEYIKLAKHQPKIL